MTRTGLSVLVVDDDADAADSLRTLLDLSGCHTRVAYSGPEALRLAAAEWPDVVLLDLMMPGLGGCELARRLVPGPRGMRPLLLAVTGCPGEADRRRARAAGIDLYLVKPVHPGLLVDILERFWRVLGPVVVGRGGPAAAAGRREVRGTVVAPEWRLPTPGVPVMTKHATWKEHEKHGHLTKQSDLPDSVFAFPGKRKEPLTDASHVRNAIARFDQVEDVTDDEREQAFANIKKAARHYGVEMTESSWKELGKKK